MVVCVCVCYIYLQAIRSVKVNRTHFTGIEICNNENKFISLPLIYPEKRRAAALASQKMKQACAQPISFKNSIAMRSPRHFASVFIILESS